jgi:hypothetical protein
MTYSVRAQGMLRAVRDGLARLNSLLLEVGSSGENLVFQIRNSKSDSPLPDRESRDLILSPGDDAPPRPRTVRQIDPSAR